MRTTLLAEREMAALDVVTLPAAAPRGATPASVTVGGKHAAPAVIVLLRHLA